MCRRKKKIRHFNGVNNRKRPNGNGTLEWLGERGWLARWTVRDLSGRKFRKSQMIRKSEKVPDVESARKVLNDLTRTNNFQNVELALLRTKQQLEGIRAERQKYIDSLPCLELDDLWDIYDTLPISRRASEGTKQMYSCQMGRFVKFVKEHHPEVKELRCVTRSIVKEFGDYLLKNFSDGTFNKYATLFTSIWDSIMTKEGEEDEGPTDFNVKKARLTMNPWTSLGRVHSIPCTRRELTLEEIRRLCSSVSGELKLLFCISLETGLRLHDSVLLDHSAIDMERGFIKLRPHKVARKNVWVTIPILPDLYAMLSKIPSEERHGYVLPNLAAEFLHSSSLFSWKLSKVFKSCGIETSIESEDGKRRIAHCGFHSLRHTFVSLAAQYNVPLSTVQAIVGHSSPAMTRHYLHLTPEVVKYQMMNFPRLLGN